MLQNSIVFSPSNQSHLLPVFPRCNTEHDQLLPSFAPCEPGIVHIHAVGTSSPVLYGQYVHVLATRGGLEPPTYSSNDRCQSRLSLAWQFPFLLNSPQPGQELVPLLRDDSAIEHGRTVRAPPILNPATHCSRKPSAALPDIKRARATVNAASIWPTALVR